MNFELFIASRLKLNKSSDAGSPGMNIALIGIMLAIIVMILSIAIVMGFKHEITDKIYQLDPHLRVTNAALGLDENYNTVNARNIDEAISPHEDFINKIHSISLIAEKPAILKTDENLAKKNNLKSMVICFDPDPNDVIKNTSNNFKSFS